MPLPENAGEAMGRLFQHLAAQNSRVPITVQAEGGYEPAFYALAEEQALTIEVNGKQLLGLQVVNGHPSVVLWDANGEVVEGWSLTEGEHYWITDTGGRHA
jgi:hypothetical protein